MAEIFLCQECHQRVSLDADEYVIPNRATARTKSQWVYSHAKCVEGHDVSSAGHDVPSAEEAEQLIQKGLELHIARMDAEGLRRLGLQRIESPDEAKGAQ